MRRLVTLLAWSLLLMQGTSFAHEGKAHPEGGTAAQMAKLHKMMPKYEQARVRLSAALEKGDAASVEKEAGYLLSTAGDLKKSKPHKNLKELKDFRKIAESFETDVKQTYGLARKGDWEGAKVSFSSAQNRCSACHAEFRD